MFNPCMTWGSSACSQTAAGSTADLRYSHTSALLAKQTAVNLHPVIDQPGDRTVNALSWKPWTLEKRKVLFFFFQDYTDCSIESWTWKSMILSRL